MGARQSDQPGNCARAATPRAGQTRARYRYEPERRAGGGDDAGYGGNDTQASRCCRPGSEPECDALPDASEVLFLDGRNGRPWLITSSDTGMRSYDKTERGVVRRAFTSSAQVGLGRP